MVPSPTTGMRAPFASTTLASTIEFKLVLLAFHGSRMEGKRLAAPRTRAGTDETDRSGGLLENLPADQHAADLARAGADLIELGVAQQPPGGIIVDVAVSAEALDGVERDRGRPLGRV